MVICTGRLSRREVYSALVRLGGWRTKDEIAREFLASPNTVRRHLERLHEDGRIKKMKCTSIVIDPVLCVPACRSKTLWRAYRGYSLLLD